MNDAIKTVLILDDEPSIRQSLTDYFEDHLWRSLQAESAEQALELLENKSINCVIVDIRLRGMNGNTFMRTAYNKNPNTAFVVCTGSSEYDVPMDLLKLPRVSNHVYRKPVTNLSGLEKDLLRLITTIRKKSI